jgi:hypothetical protein
MKDRYGKSKERFMKIIWEVEDIKPGRRYINKDTGIWLIGYRADADDCRARYVSVSENSGRVTSPYTKEELAGILNENGYLPVDIKLILDGQENK